MSDDAQDFDLDAWITDARLPERSVTVYGRADLVAEHAELSEELARLQRAGFDDDRLADPTVEVATRLKDAEARMQASALTFRFRALTRDESKVILDAAPKDKDGEPVADYLAAAWLAASSISPALVPALDPDVALAHQMDTLKARSQKFVAIRAKIGEGQFNTLWSAAWGVSNDRRPDVPFSPAASVALKNKGS